MAVFYGAECSGDFFLGLVDDVLCSDSFRLLFRFCLLLLLLLLLFVAAAAIDRISISHHRSTQLELVVDHVT